MSMITARVDDDIKTAASKLANKLGMSLSTVINIYLRKFVAEKGIKIELSDTNPAYYESDEFIEVNEPVDVVLDYLEKTLSKRKKRG